MSSKIYVLDGAMLQCNQGMAPATLLVTQNQKVKVQGKFIATDMDVQVPATFVQCKLKPTSGGYLPCIPALQKWTKTTKKTTLGKAKKFLFDDSECMCATGGKVTIIQPMQINTMGSVQEQFKNIAMTIPGAMLGNDKAPKIVETYWMDSQGSEKIDSAEYGDQATIFIQTEHMDPGEKISLKIDEQDGKDFDKDQKTLEYRGSILGDGTAKLQKVDIKEDWLDE